MFNFILYTLAYCRNLVFTITYNICTLCYIFFILFNFSINVINSSYKIKMFRLTIIKYTHKSMCCVMTLYQTFYTKGVEIKNTSTTEPQ